MMDELEMDVLALEAQLGIPDEAYVLVEGRHHDAEFYGQWLLAAVNAQALWEEVLKDRAFAKQIDRVLISYYPDFRIAAAELVLRLDYKQPSFVMPVDEENGEFVMMVGMGFFERAGEHYVMALPSQLTITKVKAAAIAYAETEDEHYYLHPYRLVVTASLVETKANQSRLHAVAEFSHNESIHGLSKC